MLNFAVEAVMSPTLLRKQTNCWNVDLQKESLDIIGFDIKKKKKWKVSASIRLRMEY